MTVRSGQTVKSLDQLSQLFNQTSSTGNNMNTNNTTNAGQNIHTPPAVPNQEAATQSSMGSQPAASMDTPEGLQAIHDLMKQIASNASATTEAAAQATGVAAAAVEAVDALRSAYETERAAAALAAEARDAEHEKLKQTVKDMQAAAAKKPTLVSRIVNVNNLGSVAGLLAFGYIAAKEYKARTTDTAEA